MPVCPNCGRSYCSCTAHRCPNVANASSATGDEHRNFEVKKNNSILTVESEAKVLWRLERYTDWLTNTGKVDLSLLPKGEYCVEVLVDGILYKVPI